MQFMCEKDVQNVQECKINIMKIPFVLLSHSKLNKHTTTTNIIYEDENSKIEINKKKRFLSSLYVCF